MYKLFSLLLVLTVFYIKTDAQCYMDRHSATWYDGWISCQTAPSPNPMRGNSHWIQYNLGENYMLHELFVWNTNAPDLLDWGMQEIVIDVSLDGITWTEIGTFTLNQATGFNRYEGEFITNLNNTKAKYVLITGLSNYGGACYGLSEIKINVDNTVNVADNNCMRANVYPNPFSNELFLNLRESCTENAISYTVYDALGRVVVTQQNIEVGSTVSLLNNKTILPGFYFIELNNGETKKQIKVIKN